MHAGSAAGSTAAALGDVLQCSQHVVGRLFYPCKAPSRLSTPLTWIRHYKYAQGVWLVTAKGPGCECWNCSLIEGASTKAAGWTRAKERGYRQLLLQQNRQQG
jgi:hypothetical protein